MKNMLIAMSKKVLIDNFIQSNFLKYAEYLSRILHQPQKPSISWNSQTKFRRTQVQAPTSQIE